MDIIKQKQSQGVSIISKIELKEFTLVLFSDKTHYVVGSDFDDLLIFITRIDNEFILEGEKTGIVLSCCMNYIDTFKNKDVYVNSLTNEKAAKLLEGLAYETLNSFFEPPSQVANN